MPSAPPTPSLDRIGVDAVHGPRVLFLADFALRNGTPGPRQLLARTASGGRWDTDELVHRLALLGKHSQGHDLAASLEPWASVQLARLLGTQNEAPSDAYRAIRLLQAVYSAHGAAKLRHEGRLLLLELLAERGETHEELESWLGTLRRNAPQLTLQVGLLRANAVNPFRLSVHGTDAPAGDTAAWESTLARALHPHGLDPVGLRPGAQRAFGRLWAEAPVADGGGSPLVSVVVSPGTGWTPSAVRSVLDQTYPTLEVLVPLWHGAGSSVAWDVDDVRVRQVDVGRAASAVHARNLAVAHHARGELVTIVDDDAWLHPRRIERQVRHLAEQPDDLACLTNVVHVTDDLVFGRTSSDPLFVRPGAGTLMMRRTAFDEVGYWDPGAPEGLADGELVARHGAMTGSPVPSVDEAPLTFVRYVPAPRGPDFVEPRARWYTSACTTWHTTSAVEELRLPAAAPEHPAVPAPAIATGRAVEVDVAYVTDYRFPGGNSSISANEIQILDDAGYRVAMVHVESPVLRNTMHLHRRALDVARRPGRILATLDDAVTARLTVVRHPTVLQLAEPRRSAITTGTLAVIVNHAPYEADLGGSWYDTAVVAANAAAIFGTTPAVYPESGLIRTLLDGMIDPRLVAEENWTGVLPAPPSVRAPRRPARRRLTGRPRPVIGRHSRDNRAKWPDADELRLAYPVDGSCDVRVLGGAAAAKKRTGIDVEAAWTVYPFGSRPVGEFLDELDFWVYLHGPELYESFGMAIVEALAAGLVVVLPDYMRQTFGDAAVYATPEEVQPLVERLWRDPEAYTAQSERAIASAGRHFGPAALIDRVARLMDDGEA